jgi:hypothetical protein
MVDESRVNQMPSSPDTASEILENCGKLELSQGEILQFFMCLQRFFATSKPSDKDNSSRLFRQDIWKTVNTILQWTSKEANEEVPNELINFDQETTEALPEETNWAYSEICVERSCATASGCI